MKRFVVSGAGFLTTFGLDCDAGSKPALVTDDAGAAQRTLMHNAKGKDCVTPCISDLSLFNGLNRSDEDLGLSAQNIWHLSKDYGWNQCKAFEAMLLDTSPNASNTDHTPFLFISKFCQEVSSINVLYQSNPCVSFQCAAKHYWLSHTIRR